MLIHFIVSAAFCATVTALRKGIEPPRENSINKGEKLRATKFKLDALEFKLHGPEFLRDALLWKRPATRRFRRCEEAYIFSPETQQKTQPRTKRPGLQIYWSDSLFTEARNVAIRSRRDNRQP